jgi:hypothetical protein
VIHLPIGNRQTVDISEPARNRFSDNLSGALQYMLAHTLYKLLELMGEGVGAFGAGIAVSFLERIEPGMVHYVTPLLDYLLKQPDLPPELKTFLLQLKSPTDEAASAILGGLGSQVGGAVVGSVLNSALGRVTQNVNKAIRPALPSPDVAIDYFRLHFPYRERMLEVLKRTGFEEEDITALIEVSKPRAGVSDLLRGWLRHDLDDAQFQTLMSTLGYDADQQQIIKLSSQPILDAHDLLALGYREGWSSEQFDSELHKLGWRSQDINRMRQLARAIPGAPDLVRMGVREAWRDDVARQWQYDADFPLEFGVWLSRLGYDPDWAKRYWRAHWELPSPNMGYEMFHRGIISQPELSSLLRILDYPAGWRNRMIDMSYNLITRVDIRRIYKIGLATRDEVEAHYRKLGYSPSDAAKLTEFVVRWEDQDGSNRLEKNRDLTQGLIMRGYALGVIDRTGVTTRLQGLGYDAEEIDFLISVSDADKHLDTIPDYEKQYRGDVKALVERAYVKRVITEADARSLLAQTGLSEQEIAYCLTVAQAVADETTQETILKGIGAQYKLRSITRLDVITQLGILGVTGAQQDALLGEWDTAREQRTDHLSRSQYEDLYYLKVISIEDYEESMRGLGYCDKDINYLITLLTWSETHPVE